MKFSIFLKIKNKISYLSDTRHRLTALYKKISDLREKLKTKKNKIVMNKYFTYMTKGEI